jgi:hypothetical protein
MLALLSRFPSLRLAARAITLALIAFPLVTLALAIESDITHLSRPAAIALLAGFSLLVAATSLLVNRMFRTVP